MPSGKTLLEISALDEVLAGLSRGGSEKQRRSDKDRTDHWDILFDQIDQSQPRTYSVAVDSSTE
jgi:hypothetical protein